MSSIKPEVGPNKAGFVFGKDGETGPNKILGAMPVDTYLVQYTDGASQKSVRLVFRVPGSKTSFILNEKIQGSFTATAGTEWFNKALASKLKELELEAAPNAGSEGAEAL